MFDRYGNPKWFTAIDGANDKRHLPSALTKLTKSQSSNALSSISLHAEDGSVHGLGVPCGPLGAAAQPAPHETPKLASPSRDVGQLGRR